MGNITKKRTLGAATNNVYTYPTSGQAQPNAVSQVNGVINGVTNPTFSYDDNGNLISGAGRTLSWTSFDKVASLTENSTTLDFTYDATQQRIKQSDGSNTILYLNDPVSGASAEYHTDNGGEWHDYLSAAGKRVGIRKEVISPSDITVQFFIQDNQGSVIAVLNEDGTLSQKLSYDAWGLRRNVDGSEDVSNSINAAVSRGYTDHEHLPGSRIINMNGRMYDPELSRHLSADPYTPEPFSSQGYNRYAYVLNNPLSFIDPSGYDHCHNTDTCNWSSPYQGAPVFCIGGCFQVGWPWAGGGGNTPRDPDPNPPGDGAPVPPPIEEVPVPDPDPPFVPDPPFIPGPPVPLPPSVSDIPVIPAPPCTGCIPAVPPVQSFGQGFRALGDEFVYEAWKVVQALPPVVSGPIVIGGVGLRVLGTAIRGIGSLDDLSRAAGVASGKNGFTVAGHALTKHAAGQRTGSSAFPVLRGNPAAINRQAQDIVDDILTAPGTTVLRSYRSRFGDTIEHVAPNGRGVVYGSDGSFLFFREGGL